MAYEDTLDCHGDVRASSELIGLPLAWLADVPNRIASHRGKIEGLSPSWKECMR